MKRSIRLLLALIAIIGVLAACTIPALATSDDPDDDDSGPPIYYVSDAAHSSTYAQLLRDNGFTVTLKTVSGISGFLEYLDSIEVYLAQGRVDVYGVNIIFELSSRVWTRDPIGTDFFFNDAAEHGGGYIEGLFALFRAYGCGKIMFICGTDEELFWNHSEFLMDVDVHINSDILYIFMSSILYRISDSDTDRRLRNITFIVDNTFNSSAIPTDAKYFTNWLYPYLYDAYLGTLGMPDWMDVQFASFVAFLNIKVFAHVGGTTYYDVVNRTTVQVDDSDFTEAIQNEHVYAIGRTMNGATYSEAWIRQMLDIRRMCSFEIPIYIFNADGFMCDEYEEDDIYRSGRMLDFSTVLLAFAADDDMTPYNNWWGMCDITHKPVFTSPNGWMRNLHGIMHINAWDLDPVYD